MILRASASARLKGVVTCTICSGRGGKSHFVEQVEIGNKRRSLPLLRQPVQEHHPKLARAKSISRHRIERRNQARTHRHLPILKTVQYEFRKSCMHVKSRTQTRLTKTAAFAP